MQYIWSHFAEHSTYWEEKHWCWKIKYLHFISIKYFFLPSEKIINILTFQSRRHPECSTRWAASRSSGRCAAAGGMSTRSGVRQRTTAGNWSEIVNTEPLAWLPPMPGHAIRGCGQLCGAQCAETEPREQRELCQELRERKWNRKKGDKLPRQSLWLTLAKVSHTQQSQSSP